jgi:protein-ribulosamine 3-kinase
VHGFLKDGAPERADAFAAEADGLEALRAHVRVPRVLDRGVKDGKAFILLEQLDLKRGGDYAQLGRMLAVLHRQTGPRFGWHRDNYIGLSPQQNGWCDDWTQFWRERRIRPQAERAGVEVRLDRIQQLLENHRVQPSLLHGDLWSGNAGFTKDGPVIFDPAAYYGDREADLAMTELFGGFPSEFYDAYNEVLPLAPGYEKRKHLYNLYHLLNHLNLFGGGYLGQVKTTLRLLGL